MHGKLLQRLRLNSVATRYSDKVKKQDKVLKPYFSFFLFSQKAPGLYFFIGGLPKGKDRKTAGPHHTPEFLIDDSSFKTGVNAFCNLVFDYPEIYKK